MSRLRAILLCLAGLLLGGCDRRSEWDVLKFTAEHVDRLARDLSLTQDQRQAALDLVAAYQLQHAEALSKIEHYRKAYEQATKAGETEEHKAHLADTTVRYERHCRALRDTLISDLRSLITAEQALAWPRFERWYRRGELLPRGTLHGESIDLEALIAALQPPVPVEGPLAEVIEQYSVTLDAALRARQELLDRPPPRAEDGLAPSDFAAALERHIDALLARRLRVRNVNFDFAERLPPLIPEAQRDAFISAFEAAAYPEVFGREFAEQAFREVYALADLSQEQRQIIDDIRSEYEAALPAANRRWAMGIRRAEDRLTARVMLARARQGDPAQAEDDDRAARMELDDRTRRRVAATLTPAQRQRLAWLSPAAGLPRVDF